MKVTLIAATKFWRNNAVDDIDAQWTPEDEYDGFDDAAALVEFSGRQCYESWSKPNLATATAKGYIKNIISQNHFSVLEHGSVSFRISGVSRSLTHELVRHRHFSFSQQSQRYVRVTSEEFVVPPLFADDAHSQAVLREHWQAAVTAYEAMTARWLPILLQRGFSPHQARKKAREAARSLLPNMTPTAIVVTGNHRSWREFLEKRGSEHADAEIRELAMLIYHEIKSLEPALYQDFRINGQVIERAGE